MDSKVRVVTDESGTIIHQSSGNPEYGYIRLEQDRTVIDDESGFLRRKVIRALLHGTMDTQQRQTSSREMLLIFPLIWNKF